MVMMSNQCLALWMYSQFSKLAHALLVFIAIECTGYYKGQNLPSLALEFDYD